MAGNKFATMLHRNTHKITVILVYVFLEWILIFLLLLNSLFAFLITKFANFFGLKQPCLWCSRVDHVLEPDRDQHSYRDHLCEIHATEISKLSYCSNHRRLAESQQMCVDCLASRPNHNEDSIGMTRRIAFFSWVSKGTIENGDKTYRCSCCNEDLGSTLYPPYLLFKPSWGALKYTDKGNLIIEAIDDDSNGCEYKVSGKSDSPENFKGDEKGIGLEINNGEEHENDDQGTADECHQMLPDVEDFGPREVAEDCSRSESNLQYDENEGTHHVDEKAGCQESDGMNFLHPSADDTIIDCCFSDDDSLKIIHLFSKRNVEGGLNRFIPVEVIDSSTMADHGSLCSRDEDLEKQDHQNESFVETQVDVMGQAETVSVMVEVSAEKNAHEELESMAIGDNEKSSILIIEKHQPDLAIEASENVSAIQASQTLSTNGNISDEAAMKEPDSLPEPAHGEEQSNHLISSNQRQTQEPVPPLPCVPENNSSTNDNSAEIPNARETCMPQSDLGSKNVERAAMSEKMILVDKNQDGVNHHLYIRSEPNEAEDEKFPETPTSLESFQYLQRKLLLFEKRESGTEESLDGSVVSETDAGDPVQAVERLKTALKAERKTLSALYAELEEERSASAIAANQTMAMITRLQEEKAAMQMEALQYQRMMEEQSEYDQEALQLLNELMIKREKEKQEVEKELELYRKRVFDYEAKERLRMMRRTKNGSVRSRNSCASCSYTEDTDELSIDLNREARDEDSSICEESGHNNTPVEEVINLQEMALDCVKHMGAMDDSLAEFDEERLSILDQLKALEEKLITLGCDEQFIEEMNSMEHSFSYSVGGLGDSHDFSSPEENTISNGFVKDELHPGSKTLGSMAKSLLPLLDATDNETEGLINENVEAQSVEMQGSAKSDLDIKKLALEEEVDHVYERLQALEADREFLKHCLSSIKKGDKGVDLLQEILQHLRDLRTVELHERSINDDPLG